MGLIMSWVNMVSVIDEMGEALITVISDYSD